MVWPFQRFATTAENLARGKRKQEQRGEREKRPGERGQGMGLFGFLSLPRAAKKKGVGRSEGSVTRKEKNLGKNN